VQRALKENENRCPVLSRILYPLGVGEERATTKIAVDPLDPPKRFF
jgi:hypothetical protein